MRNLFVLLGGFLAVSLGMWNGCFGVGKDPGSEVSAAQARGTSDDSGDHVGHGISMGVALRSLVGSARHPDLREPAFPEFRSEIERLYERAAWQPLWLESGGPTEAATLLIARLTAGDSVGLDPADYDAEWLGQEARECVTHRGTRAPEDLARFDLGLSVAAVRFVSALHHGRVSPRARWRVPQTEGAGHESP